MGNNWQLKEHNEVERPYWEITNGPISLCVNDEDFDDEQKIVRYRLSTLVQRLNNLNVDFHSENALEFKQHTEIMQLQTEVADRKREYDDLQAQVNELDAIVNLFDKLGDCVLVRDSISTYNRKKALQQWKDGKGKEDKQ